MKKIKSTDFGKKILAMAKKAKDSIVYPVIFYDKDGDILTVLLNKDDYRSELTSPNVISIISRKTQKVIGLEIWGVKKLIK